MTFYTCVPQEVIDSKAMSAKAKIIYEYLLRLHEMSRKNTEQFQDERGIFIYCARMTLMTKFDYAKGTVINALKELKSNGLIDEVRQGQGKVNKIYVKDLFFGSRGSKKQTSKGSKIDTSASSESELQEVQKVDRNNNIKNNSNYKIIDDNKTTTTYYKNNYYSTGCCDEVDNEMDCVTDRIGYQNEMDCITNKIGYQNEVDCITDKIGYQNKTNCTTDRIGYQKNNAIDSTKKEYAILKRLERHNVTYVLQDYDKNNLENRSTSLWLMSDYFRTNEGIEVRSALEAYANQMEWGLINLVYTEVFQNNDTWETARQLLDALLATHFDTVNKWRHHIGMPEVEENETSLQTLCRLFIENFGKKPNHLIVDYFRYLLDFRAMEFEIIKDAFDIALRKNKGWDYAEGVLKNRVRNGILTIEDLVAEDRIR